MIYNQTNEGKVLIYEGEFSGTLEPNGQGLRRYEGNDTLEGKFKDGEGEGRCKYTWSDGSFEEGNFVQGIEDGKFRF